LFYNNKKKFFFIASILNSVKYWHKDLKNSRLLVKASYASHWVSFATQPILFCKNYNLLIKIRLKNKRTNLGNIYLDKMYIITTNIIKAKITWLIK